MAVSRIAAQHPDLEQSSLVRYAWHGTKGKYAYNIVHQGFNIDMAGKSNGMSYVHYKIN